MFIIEGIDFQGYIFLFICITIGVIFFLRNGYIMDENTNPENNVINQTEELIEEITENLNEDTIEDTIEDQDVVNKE